MSWDLSSEEVICSKLESQQTTIFAFSKKIKDLETKNDELEKKFKEAFEAGQASAIPRMRELEKKLEIAVTCLKELRPVIEQGEDWELGKWIEKALAAINGEGYELDM